MPLRVAYRLSNGATDDTTPWNFADAITGQENEEDIFVDLDGATVDVPGKSILTFATDTTTNTISGNMRNEFEDGLLDIPKPTIKIRALGSGTLIIRGQWYSGGTNQLRFMVNGVMYSGLGSFAVSENDVLEITEAVSGDFKAWISSNPFCVGVPVEIELPPMEAFLIDGHIAGHYFFKNFNRMGSIVSFTPGSLDTSMITQAGKEFFRGFNQGTAPGNGTITSLPEGSFNLDNLTSVSTYFLAYFNINGGISALPTGSFNTSNITTLLPDPDSPTLPLGYDFLDSFNLNGLIPQGSLPIKNAYTGAKDAYYWNGSSSTSVSIPSGGSAYYMEAS